MAETILVVVEQRQGKFNRVSLETLAAAQELAAETGWPVEALVLGSGVGEVARLLRPGCLHVVRCLKGLRTVTLKTKSSPVR